MRYFFGAAALVLLGGLICNTSYGAGGFADTAVPQRCWLIATSTLDISAGAATSAEFDAREGLHGAGGALTPLPSSLKLALDLTDANTSVTRIDITAAGLEATGGQAYTVALGTQASNVISGKAATLRWDPSVDGKHWYWRPVDWAYPFGTITATPTGQGSGDSLVIGIYGCAE